MRTRVKICGITNLTDAETAINAGADALGFIFVPETPRYITPNSASEIIRALPPFITTVGVFRNVEHKVIEDIATETGITSVQLHGTESPEFCQQLSFPVVKVFELQTKEDLQFLEDYNVSAFLVDKPKSISGGMINLELALKARHHTNRLILAGGLTPENVVDAVQYVKPYAVDVASGVELEKRRKDPQKIKAFIRAVRHADEV
ncbi:MAG: phosphoribosylanthranilate isomerase [Candidatus Poribacteria bacterium]|nr:phosphoribosylanthranilate isomerase [Candidatus Poribacteria bacterium]